MLKNYGVLKMIKILEFLWSGCWHYWEHQFKITMVDKGDETVGYRMAYKCKKCQQYKTRRLV